MKTNPEYGKICGKLARRREKNRREWGTLSTTEKKQRLKEIKALQREQLSIEAHPGELSSRKWLVYVRYADDFLIGIGGCKEDARKIKQEISEYLSSKLHLTMSMEKTKITHTSETEFWLRLWFKCQDNETKSDSTVSLNQNKQLHDEAQELSAFGGEVVTAGKYDDIINLPYKQSNRRPHMSL